MNYRHLFHAGNFADLLKHAVLTRLLRSLTASPAALSVIDTHAGAGLYDLSSEAAHRTGEGQAGVGRLMADPDAPPVFGDLRAAVRRANPRGGLRFYPGSPLIIEAGLRPRDSYVASELRPDDHAALKAALSRQTGALALKGDGWTIASERAPASPKPLLALIDPPFERPGDADRAIELSGKILRRNRAAVVAVWVPIKDLAGFDAIVGGLQDAVGRAALMVAETRLRPLSDPMRLNGCAMLVVNAPASLKTDALSAARWIAGALGEPGADGRVMWTGG
jgi:23S rRNA (adenine2030-N6)-methyltransferase